MRVERVASGVSALKRVLFERYFGRSTNGALSFVPRGRLSFCVIWNRGPREPILFVDKSLSSQSEGKKD
jgi:hypothetical protein